MEVMDTRGETGIGTQNFVSTLLSLSSLPVADAQVKQQPACPLPGLPFVSLSNQVRAVRLPALSQQENPSPVPGKGWPGHLCPSKTLCCPSPQLHEPHEAGLLTFSSHKPLHVFHKEIVVFSWVYTFKNIICGAWIERIYLTRSFILSLTHI